MSNDLPLPEDTARWPDDPWELLGIARGAPRREIRKAYARRIRAYKPEHFPEEFRRIRDAYEQLDAMASYAADAPPVEPAAEYDAGAEPIAQPQAAAPPKTDDSEQIAWRMAEEGRLDDSYREHLRLWEAGGRRDDELCLRLYWLRRLYAQADPTLEACDLLAAGLAASELSDRLLDLYWRELLRNPEEAFTARFEALLSAPARPQRRADLLAIRWQAASALGRFQVFAADLRRARQSIATDDPTVWFTVLLQAMDHLAWETGEEHLDLYHACRKEAAQGDEAHLKLEAAFDRADFLGAMAADYHRLRVAPGTLGQFASRLLPLVRNSWTQPTARWRGELLHWLADALVEPLKTLNCLDAMKNVASVVVVRLNALVEMLDRQRRDPGSDAPSEERLKHAREFLESYGTWDYGVLRRNILCTCLWDRMTTAQFAASLGEVVQPEILERTGVCRQLDGDLPLALLSRAALALWP